MRYSLQLTAEVAHSDAANKHPARRTNIQRGEQTSSAANKH